MGSIHSMRNSDKRCHCYWEPFPSTSTEKMARPHHGMRPLLAGSLYPIRCTPSRAGESREVRRRTAVLPVCPGFEMRPFTAPLVGWLGASWAFDPGALALDRFPPLNKSRWVEDDPAGRGFTPLQNTRHGARARVQRCCSRDFPDRGSRIADPPVSNFPHTP